MRHAFPLCIAAALGALACVSPAPDPVPYVFGWPFLEEPLAPRGGTTQGAPVVLDLQPSEAWRRLRAPELDARARDRVAILALAGDYRASFDFLETVLFEPGAGPARPYRSWGTERIYVVEEREDFIQLQHVLVMFVMDDAGAIQGPFVQKHWRQDWHYEPGSALVYTGARRFETRPVAEAARRGVWSQTVYQVDDSPRYASLGRWRHGEEASVWDGGEAWRPLPRREHTVRDDYQVLAGTHRLTVLPTGWVHEQDNAKLVLEGGAARPIAREAGLNRYERLRGFDFAAADAYWSATAHYWARVREAWARRFAAHPRVEVDTRCDDEPGFVPLFRMAARIEAGEEISEGQQESAIEEALDCRVRPLEESKAPTFDCGGARGSVEQTICTDAELAALDRELDGVYRRALAGFPPEEVSRLRALQRGWIAGRNDCWKEEDVRSCAVQSYERRIAELQIATGSLVVPAPTLYRCDDGARPSVYFYRDTLIPSAVLNLGSEQEVLFLTRSGSGARYQGRNSALWTKGEEARLERWGSPDAQCRRFVASMGTTAPQ